MSDHSEAFVAFDTSKLRNAVAIADAGRAGEVRFLGEIENTRGGDGEAGAQACRQVRAADVLLRGGADRLRAATGRSRASAHECVVVAPSLIPKRPGDRVKTNRRDALSLAKLLRADELTAVWVPDGRHEAMRDLTRARETAMHGFAHASASRSRPFCCGRDGLSAGKKTWTKAHMSWLASQKLEHPEQRIVFEEMMLAMRQAQERLERLEQAIARGGAGLVACAEVVTALMAMRGIDLISATTFLAEIGDLSRFQTPRELMAYLGLVPSEDSTGDTIKRGPITKAGNRRARRMLVECSWSYQHPPRVGQAQAAEGRRGAAGGSRDRLEGAVPPVPALSRADQEGQAQDRRHHRGRARARRLHLGGQLAKSPPPVPRPAKAGLPKGASGNARHLFREPAPGHGPAKTNLVQRRERSRGKGNSRSSCEADRKIDARPQTGTAPDGHTDMREPANKSLLTDVSGLRSYRCTIIASTTSHGIRGEGGMLRRLGLTWDIRAPRGARPALWDAGRCAQRLACRVRCVFTRV